MDPRSNNTSGLGLPAPANDMGQLPPIHTPQSFRAPDTAASHFDAVAQPMPQIGTVAPAAQSMPVAEPQAAPAAAISVAPVDSPAAQVTAQLDQQMQQPQIAPSEDTDTAFDEEWVNKAREVVSRAQTDPYIQSDALSKLKSQYIKLRYNKDIKTSE